MRVIPVIDLLDGHVVHAQQGQRERYRPIQSPLCRGSAPHAVIDALLGLHGFTTLYVADLDALMGKGGQRGLLERLQHDYPGLRFWVDQGLAAPVGRAVAVVGSESLDEAGIKQLPSLEGCILSLDFIGERLLGAQSLLQNPELWPEKIIIMSLSRVGASAGPDFGRLAEFRAAWPNKRFIAAGGVRHAEDLRQLDALGMAGVLLASALHSGAVGREELGGYG